MLNAFRHQRKNHCHQRPVIGVGMCSTPFGINERITDWNEDLPMKSPSAQRLSASTKESLMLTDVCVDSSGKCSTPFGINERITPAVTDRLLRSATGAQRLSASTKESPAACGAPVLASRVLNAFRHQRKNHRCTRQVTSTVVKVLNAFRHQRKNHLGCII